MNDLMIFEREKTPVQEEMGSNYLPEQDIVFGNGIWMYLEGHSLPHKGLPTPEAVTAVNVAKRLLLNGYTTPHGYVKIVFPLISPFILKPEYQTDFTREFIRTTKMFLVKLGIRDASALSKIFGHIFEYDQAYRFRMQDLLGAASKYSLTHCPQKEIARLVEISRKRDYNEVSDKFKKVAWLIRIALLVPQIRTAFIESIEASNFEKLQPDDNDLYWMSLKTDYNYAGRRSVP